MLRDVTQGILNLSKSLVFGEAIQRECVGSVFEGDFPKYAWGWLDGQLYEARLTNRSQGFYKGYPLEELEKPIDPELSAELEFAHKRGAEP